MNVELYVQKLGEVDYLSKIIYKRPDVELMKLLWNGITTLNCISFKILVCIQIETGMEPIGFNDSLAPPLPCFSGS